MSGAVQNSNTTITTGSFPSSSPSTSPSSKIVKASGELGEFMFANIFSHDHIASTPDLGTIKEENENKGEHQLQLEPIVEENEEEEDEKEPEK